LLWNQHRYSSISMPFAATDATTVAVRVMRVGVVLVAVAVTPLLFLRVRSGRCDLGRSG
jgi:hypothetical protein